MTTPQGASAAAPSFLERWARFSHRNRWKIVGAWIVILAALTVANQQFGGSYITEFKVPGAEAEKAANLLKDRFPALSGDSSDVVIQAPGGIADPVTQQRIRQLTGDLAALPGVTGVESPLDNPALISQSGTIARMSVQWDQAAFDLPASEAKQFVKTADNANTAGFRVEVGGHVVESTEQPAFGSEIYGLIAAVIILLIAFGSVIAMGLPLAGAVFGLGAGFATIGLATNLGSFPEFSPQFAAMIGLGVGIDYSLLIVTRFREGLHAGKSVEDAIVLATTTAGRAVLFAGMVVAVAFLGLFLMGLPFVAALGTAGALMVLFAVLVALTLVPAVMSLVGRRVDSLRVPLLHSTEGVDTGSVWFRLSEAIQKHPLRYFLVTAAVLLLLASPTLAMNLAFTDAGNNPTSRHTRRAYDLLVEGFGPGFNGPLIIAADTSAGGADRIDAVVSAIKGSPGVAEVSPPIPNAAGDTTFIRVFPASSPQDAATQALVDRLRTSVIPDATKGSGARVYVGGFTAGSIDAKERITSRMPLLFAGVIGLSFVLLTVVFRSVVVAAKAAVMNLLSIGASYGVLVAIFQWGWFAGALGIQKGPIETFLPMMMFAILFGLSMDYEVFLISRIREEYVETRNNALAVGHGLAATARVITAAAAIMVAVFLTFVLGDERVIKEFGIGLATAIFVDATIVRLVLVPSTMELLGDRNWWLPSWLDRLLPNVSFEGTRPQSAPAPVAARNR
ncbi:MAG: MMPL family transporter [Chloroflexi bacterium]|nr:MMPL family transporter [Chloroflexota bacterium]